MAMQESPTEDCRLGVSGPGAAATTESRLRAELEMLDRRVRKGDQQRRAMLHIMGDLNQSNRRLTNHRKAMLHILADYEQDRQRMARQTERLDNSRRALLHILQGSHQDNLRLERSRKAMIHIMDDLRETTEEMQRREQELRDKQEQLVQAGKLATLGELTTGVAHELNNPLNNTALFVGNAIDLIELGATDHGRTVRELRRAMQQVRKATEIISHLRTFGRAAPVSREVISLKQVIEQALSLLEQQLRLREVEVTLDLGPKDAVVAAPRKAIHISGTVVGGAVEVAVADTGHGIPPELERRIFDPFFTTKEVGKGMGLGLSITYGIIKEHGGTISVVSPPGEGAAFLIHLPLAA